MNHFKETQLLSRLGINWLGASIYFGSLLVAAIYEEVKKSRSLIDALGIELTLFALLLAWAFTNVSQTIFLLTPTELTIKKPFLPYLMDKNFKLDELKLVECQYKTGKTLQPSFYIHLKNGNKWFWWTGASLKRCKQFLKEAERLGVRISLTGTLGEDIDLDSEESIWH